MPSHGTYSTALRCVGQALEKQRIEFFDLKYEQEKFYIKCEDPNSPHVRLIELRYSADDIDTLERDGQAKRCGSFKMVNYDGLPETLRAIGKYIDDKGGHLLRICNSDVSPTKGAIKLEYQTPSGYLQAEELPKASIYETMMEMYKERY
jgi:hypothetical protein